jgi:hypothetical protein
MSQVTNVESEDIIALDKRSRDLEVVVVRRIINLGTWNLEWGGGMGRS